MPDDKDLGALVASPHFRWRVGLPVQAGGIIDGGGVVVFVSLQGFPTVEDSKGWRSVEHPRDIAPVADDPFFKGWLLHLVREAWGPNVYLAPVTCDGKLVGWNLWDALTHTRITRETLPAVDALVAALLAAPPKETS